MKIMASSQMKLFSSILIPSFVLVSIFHCEQLLLATNQTARSGESIDTCAGLQIIANRVWKKHGISFQGFENLPMKVNIYPNKEGTDRLCQLGYFTKVSPMGKQICKGYIYTSTTSTKINSGYGLYRSTFYDRENYESEYCRYIN
jgi:hypothetical protein